MLRTGEAAKLLGVTKTTLLAWIGQGRLRALNVSCTDRPQYRLDRSDLDAFRAAITVNPASQQGAV